MIKKFVFMLCNSNSFDCSAKVKTLIGNFFNWFRWRPRMSKPLPVILNPTTNEEISDKRMSSKCNVQIVITVFNAKNVPNRTKHTLNDSDSEVNEVKSFVRIDYKNISVRTDTVKGCNPVWNQNLHIPLE